MNTAILLGGLTDTPKLGTTSMGKNFTYFTLAVSRKYGDKEDTQYINCVAWDKTAENITKYCIKGCKLLVDGRLQTRSYEGQDGIRRYATEVVVRNATFISRPKSAAAPSSTDDVPTPSEKPVESVTYDDLMNEADYPFDQPMIGNKEEIRRWLFMQADNIIFEIKKYRKKRSLNANSYFWKLLEEMASVLHTTKDELYLIELKKWGISDLLPYPHGRKPIFKYYEFETTSMLNGKPADWYKIFKGTSDYDSKEMATLIDGVVDDCEELGIETKTPEELEKIKSLWK